LNRPTWVLLTPISRAASGFDATERKAVPNRVARRNQPRPAAEAAARPAWRLLMADAQVADGDGAVGQQQRALAPRR
jgi:hypothetical protein